MKQASTKRVSIAWLLLAAIGSGAGLIAWKVGVTDAPPTGALFITSEQQGDVPSATITPFGASPLLVPDASRSVPVERTPIMGASVPPAAAPTVTESMIAVYITGEVARPGVYNVPDGSRVEVVLRAAGGPTADADLEALNLAEKVRDEQHLTVLKVGHDTIAAAGIATLGTSEPSPAAPTKPPRRTPTPNVKTPPTKQPAGQTAPSARIDVNRATAADLELLPGVGPTLAARIIADRTTNGPFKSVQDLMRVSGIKEGILAKIADYIIVGP